MTQFDITLLAGSTRGFSGAEIEQAVLSAAFEALAQRRPMSQQDLMAAVSRTVPMSVIMAEQIKKIEAWAFKRAGRHQENSPSITSISGIARRIRVQRYNR